MNTFVLLPLRGRTSWPLRLATFCALVWLLPFGAHATTLSVPSQYATIQAAVNAAASGDTVMVADGTYSGNGNRDIDLLGKNLTVTSQSGASQTVIDCAGTASDPHRGFYIHRGETQATIAGIGIQNGYTTTQNGVTDSGSGGAICVGGSGVTISGCTFTNNSALNGGAICINSGSTVTFAACAFLGNSADQDGGGMYTEGTSTLTNCIFVGNVVGEYGGGINSFGSTTLRFCTFTQNADTGDTPPDADTEYYGGAINGGATATDCIFYGDTAQYYPELADGISASYCDVQDSYPGTGNIDADPLFVRAPDLSVSPPDYGDLHLQNGSPCIGAGMTVDGVTTDLDGVTRPDPPSIGAYEYVAIPPVLSALSPVSATAGGPAFTLTLTGQGFVNATSVVYFGSTPLTTTFVSPSELTVMVPASAIATIGSRSVTVKNPPLAGGTSNSIAFAVTGSITLTLGPTVVSQGVSCFAKIALSAPVAGSATINITSSNPSAASVPASVLVPAGSSGVRFDIATASTVTADTPVTITVSYSGGSASAVLTVKAIYTAKGNIKASGTALSGVTVTAASTGTFTLSQAGPGGMTIPAGGTATVSLPITAPGTIIDTQVGVKVTYPNIYKLAVSLIAPDGTAVLLRSTRSGTATGTGFETDYPALDAPAQSLSVLNGKPVQGTWKLQVQNTGSDTGTIDIFDLNFTCQGTLTQSATTNSSGDYTVSGLKAATYTLTPSKTGYGFSPATKSVTVGPNSTGDNFTAGLKPTVMSVSPTSGSSGGGDYTITVNGTNFVAGSVVKYSGTALTTTFISSTQLKAVIPSALRATPGTAQITVTNPAPGGTSNVVPFTFTPKLTGLSLSPTSFAGGGTVTGTVTLNGAAPSGGTVITLSSSDTGTATVPSTVTVTAGLTSATFPVTVKSITSTKTVTIAATGAGATKTATLTVSPTKLSTLSLASATAAGGTPVTATVKLTGTAPSGGTKVSLSSSNTGVATVPSSVTVASGATTAMFTVTTKTVSSNTNVTITAVAGGVTKTQVLTVTPASTSAPVLNSISPTTRTAGGGSFVLTANGSNFVSGSIIKWNGATQTTTFVSATKLTTTIPASLITSAGTASITVTTPHVGTSGSKTLTINP